MCGARQWRRRWRTGRGRDIVRVSHARARTTGGTTGGADLRPDHASIQLPSNTLAYFGGVFIVLMMLHIVADVLGRELFGRPIDGTLETVAFYYMVAVTFFPLAFVSHGEGHITVELFTRGLPRRRLAGLEVVVGLACLAFVVLFVYQTWIAALDSFETGEMWETSDDLITIWPSRFALPIGAALMGIYMIYRIVDDVQIARGKRAGNDAWRTLG